MRNNYTQLAPVALGFPWCFNTVRWMTGSLSVLLSYLHASVGCLSKRLSLYAARNCIKWCNYMHSMRWFSHRRGTGGGSRPRGRLPNKMPHFFVIFVRWTWPLALTFKLGREFCRTHVTAKFHHATFNRSEVIVLTNWQTDADENINLAPLCYAGG